MVSMMHKVKYFKKIIALFAAIAILLSALPSTIAFADAAVLKAGDADEDEQITSQDALEVLKYAAGLVSFDEMQKDAADVNDDEKIDAQDALLILKYAAKLIDAFPKDTSEVTATPELSESEVPQVAFSGNVWIVGDSIAAYHDKFGYERPLYGWGEIIPEYYTGSVSFKNMAVSSQSSKSYLNESAYKTTYNNIKENDYVIISFGHNDHNTTGGTSRVTNPDKGSDITGSFKYYLKNYYIDPALEKGAVPILMSSVVRCFYSGNNKFDEEPVHLKYGKAMRELVEEYAAQGITIYMIDAQTYTYELYSTLTEEEAMLYHGLGQPSWGQWYKDTTHYSEAGARMITEFIVSELAKMTLGINDHRKN